ncbi:hypothetical protein T12_14859 [Trichinella patagoniensis]|uniref:Uncharacterized protein n=1 Tax=Trichinella patagoniensis TaxID=990121 RepID=A0A0V0Z5Z0_9BILA|nr:hypothetical protein T12_14859 [Trichinella patagoniensis]
MTTQDRNFSETKQSYSCIHFHRKMHRLLKTLWSNRNAEMNALAIIQRLVVVVEDTKRLAKSHCSILTITKRKCFGVIQKVGLFLLWSFTRFTTLKTFMEKLIAEGTLKNQKYGHLDTLCDSLQHITEWNDSTAASKAEQLRVAGCRSSILLSLAVLNKVLALALPLSKSFQDSCLEKNGGLNERSVFVRFGKQLKSCTVIEYPSLEIYPDLSIQNKTENITHWRCGKLFWRTLFSSSSTNCFNTAIMLCDKMPLYTSISINISTTKASYSCVKLHAERGKTYFFNIIQLTRLMLLHSAQTIITRWCPYSYRFSPLTQSPQLAQNKALLQRTTEKTCSHLYIHSDFSIDIDLVIEKFSFKRNRNVDHFVGLTRESEAWQKIISVLIYPMIAGLTAP